jgi:hypothetical protein
MEDIPAYIKAKSEGIFDERIGELKLKFSPLLSLSAEIWSNFYPLCPSDPKSLFRSD